MTPTDPQSPSSLRPPENTPSPRVARASLVLAVISLALGTGLLTIGHWGPGLILIFAAVAGIMTAIQVWPMRKHQQRQNTDDGTGA